MTVKPQQGADMHAECLHFIGTLTASFSHELNNVLSIVDQNAGLLDDLLAGSRHGRPLSEERLQRICETMRRQTERGLTLIKRINSFAHSTDAPLMEFDAASTLANLADLCGRFCDMKKVTLVRHIPAERIAIIGNPFLFQMFLFRSLRRALNAAHPGENIEISLDASASTVAVTINAAGGLAEATAEEDAIDRELVAQVSARVDADPNNRRLTAYFPVDTPQRGA